MDPITSAIVASAATAAAGGAKEVVSKAILDAYDGLKSLIRRKMAKRPELIEAVTKLEQNPQSPARRLVVAEEVKAAGADRDTELIAAARALLAELALDDHGHSQVATGTNIAQADRGSTATVSITRPAGKADE